MRNMIKGVLILGLSLLFAGTSLAQNLPNNLGRPAEDTVAREAARTAAEAAAQLALQKSASLGGVMEKQADGTYEYTLGPGDKLRVTVFGEDDITGEYNIDSTGAVALPLIGDVSAGGKTLRSLETQIEQKLAEGYLKDPQVSVEVLNYRPFFILGEVKTPGSYPFVNGMTVLNAVALAGGFTYRANENRVTLIRATDASKQEQPTTPEMLVLPGDILRVPERFF